MADKRIPPDYLRRDLKSWKFEFYFAGAPDPNNIYAADVDCDGQVSVADVVYLSNLTLGVIPSLCCNNTPYEPWRHILFNQQWKAN